MRECQHLVLIALLALAGCDSGEPPKAKAAANSTPPASQPAAAVPVAPAPAAAPVAPAPPQPPPVPQPQSQAVFSTEQLDQMLAPLALYPDSLLAQVLMATTYPGNVADAAAWSKAHPKVSGDDAVKQVADQPWDPSVQSLVAFPAVLATLEQDPAWVQRVGDAFLAQPDAVMDSIQRLRRQAQAAGNLQSNEQQTVTVKPAAPPPAENSSSSTTVVQQPTSQTIVIEPTNPQVVYVPSYNPTQVYGTWAYPSSPPTYYPPPPEYPVATALATGLAFGAGIAIVNSLWGDCDWDRHDVDIDVNRYNNININRQINANGNTWRHNPVYRNGVPYRDSVSRQQYDRRLAGSEQRQALRGFDSNRAEERSRARDSLAQRGITAPASSNQQARERAQAATRDLRDNPQAQQRLQQANRDLHDNQQARERAQAATRDLRNDPEARQRAQNMAQNRSAQSPRQRAQNNTQVRDHARQQYSRAQAPRNNAFAGANNPRQSREFANRGQASRAVASRPQAVHAGHTVQRPARSFSGGGRRGR